MQTPWLRTTHDHIETLHAAHASPVAYANLDSPSRQWRHAGGQATEAHTERECGGRETSARQGVQRPPAGHRPAWVAPPPARRPVRTCAIAREACCSTRMSEYVNLWVRTAGCAFRTHSATATCTRCFTSSRAPSSGSPSGGATSSSSSTRSAGTPPHATWIQLEPYQTHQLQAIMFIMQIDPIPKSYCFTW